MRYVKTFEQYNPETEDKLFYRADHFERTNFDKGAFSSVPGMHFTTDKQYAESYGPYVSCVKVHVSNPYIVTEVNDITDWNFDYDELVEKGYDSVYYTDPIYHSSIIYTFYPEQIQVIKQYTL